MALAAEGKVWDLIRPSLEEISDNFDMPEQTIRDLLTYAANKHES